MWWARPSARPSGCTPRTTLPMPAPTAVPPPPRQDAADAKPVDKARHSGSVMGAARAGGRRARALHSARVLAPVRTRQPSTAPPAHHPIPPLPSPARLPPALISGAGGVVRRAGGGLRGHCACRACSADADGPRHSGALAGRGGGGRSCPATTYQRHIIGPLPAGVQSLPETHLTPGHVPATPHTHRTSEPPPPIPSKPPRYPASISLQYLMVKELFALADAAGPPRAPRGSRLRWYIFGVAAFWLYARLVRRQLAEEVAAAASGGAAAAAARWLLRRHALAAFALYTAGFVAFVLSLVKGRYRDQFRQHAWTHLTLLFVFVPSSLFVANIFDGGIIWFLLPTSLVIVNDCGAYLAGKGVGRGGAGGGRGGAGGGWSGGGAREQPATPTFAVRPWRPSPQPLPRPCQASFLAAPR